MNDNKKNQSQWEPFSRPTPTSGASYCKVIGGLILTVADLGDAATSWWIERGHAPSDFGNHTIAEGKVRHNDHRITDSKHAGYWARKDCEDACTDILKRTRL